MEQSRRHSDFGIPPQLHCEGTTEIFGNRRLSDHATYLKRREGNMKAPSGMKLPMKSSKMDHQSKSPYGKHTLLKSKNKRVWFGNLRDM